MGTTERPFGFLAMSLTAKDFENMKLPFIKKEYGVKTPEGSVLNFGADKESALETAGPNGIEVVFRSISEWLPLSDEG
jgi:hypothetical protein